MQENSFSRLARPCVPVQPRFLSSAIPQQRVPVPFGADTQDSGISWDFLHVWRGEGRIQPIQKTKKPPDLHIHSLLRPGMITSTVKLFVNHVFWGPKVQNPKLASDPPNPSRAGGDPVGSFKCSLRELRGRSFPRAAVWKRGRWLRVPALLRLRVGWAPLLFRGWGAGRTRASTAVLCGIVGVAGLAEPGLSFGIPEGC